MQPSSDLKHNQEFQSSLVRFVIWFFAVGFVLIGVYTGHYQIDLVSFLTTAVAILGLYLGVFASILRRPSAPWRPYVSIFGDLTATTLILVYVGDPLNPFFLMYLWISLYGGTRYGKYPLLVATASGVALYTGLLTAYSVWISAPLDAVFHLVILSVLPLYMHTLLQRLRTAREVAERANRSRGAFLAHISHELRTPINGVLGMAWLLRSTPLDKEQREYTDSLMTSAKLLQALIGDVLDLSKIDANKMDLQEVAFDPGAVLVEVCHGLSDQWLATGVELVCDIDPRVPRLVRGDDLRFRQIFLNLVSNAVKFTEEGTIAVRAYPAGPANELTHPHLLIEVEDTGIGMSPQLVERIFEPFVQADTSMRRRYGGSGLGTSIAAELTRLMGGVISVSSIQGQGSRFSVRLPLPEVKTQEPDSDFSALAGRCADVWVPHDGAFAAVEKALRFAGVLVRRLDNPDAETMARGCDLLILKPQPAAPDEVAVEDSQGLDVPRLYLVEPRRVTFHAAEPGAGTLTSPFAARQLLGAVTSLLRGGEARDDREYKREAMVAAGDAPEVLRVLIAEDDEVNALLVSRLVEKAGHRPVVVRNGRAALRAAMAEPFDLALVDVRMPEMSGVDFLRLFRAQEAPQNRLPVVAVTADATEDTRIQCLAAGADAVYTKPVDPERLVDLLETTATVQPRQLDRRLASVKSL